MKPPRKVWQVSFQVQMYPHRTKLTNNETTGLHVSLRTLWFLAVTSA
jgi:hypothetical protein